MDTPIPARAAAALLLLVLAFQVALILGAPWGRLTQGGGTAGALGASGRLVAAVSVVVLAVMASALLATTNVGPMRRAPHGVITTIVWITVIYSGLGVVMNAASPSWGETVIWVPVTLAGFILSAIALRRWRRLRATGPAGTTTEYPIPQ